MTKPDIILEMEEALGFPLQELKHSEILPWYDDIGIIKIYQGYSLDEKGEVIGLRFEGCNVEDIINLVGNLPTLTSLNLANAWPYNCINKLLSRQQGGKNLSGLNLGNTKLPDYSLLKDLRGLVSLDLNYNRLSNISFLKSLPGLTSLDLSNTFIKDYTILKDLKNLTSLNIGFNFIKDVSFLKNLNSLSSLFLQTCKLTDVSFLNNLHCLTTLDLASTKLSDYSFLRELHSLKSLNLRNNNLKDVTFLKKMKNLASLNLNNNALKDVSILGDLKGLTSLDLSSTAITNVSFLNDLKNITSLNLNFTPTDISFLKDMHSLTSLSLAQTGIKDYTFLNVFKDLNSLCIANNKLKDVTFLKDLNRLHSIDLSSNNINDISVLKNLHNLTILYLNNNKLTDVSSLKNLTGLTTLYLSSNNIEDVAPLKNLTGLTTLNLRSNKVTDVSFLRNLNALTVLDLSCTRIPNIYFLNNLKGLNNLSILDLSTNNLSDVTFLNELKRLNILKLDWNNLTHISGLSNFKTLTYLDLSYNKLTDVSFLTNLHGLTSLIQSNNDLSDISVIKKLKNLTYLELKDNKLTDVSDLKDVHGLTSLNLSNNKLTDVSFLKDLHGLTSLNLSNNDLSDVSVIKNLKNLTYLELKDNKLTDVSFINDLDKLAYITMDNNPITNPPKEIVDKGLSAIREYFASLEQEGEEFVYEAKLILVGEPGAGKTSLVRKLLDPDYVLNPTEPMTKGIYIDPWYFPYNSEITFRANIWDFGGQEIMHATHRYFLTQRSLYIVLADNRKEDTDFYYWLRMAELLGGKSPVIIVLNEKYDFKKFIPQGLVKSFHNVKDVCTINLATNKGLGDLTGAIQKHLTGLDHVGKTPLPKTWVRIREALEALDKDHINLKEYFELFNKHGIGDDKKALFVSEFLHDLGQVLHFQKDRILRSRIILNPHWATEAVYLVLLDSKIIQNCGRFTNDDIKRIWSGEEYKYNHADLLRLMINFELCYEIGNSQVYIIPELLDEKPATEGYPPAFEPGSTQTLLQFEYRYAFMPKGIISRLMVRMNRYIYKNLRWKNGVVLHCHAYAEVIEYIHQRKLKIRIYGEDKQLCLTMIRDEIKEIHDSFEKLEYYEMIPCICGECRDAKTPYFFKYSLLQQCKQKGKSTWPCEKSMEEVSVEQLLKGIEAQRKVKINNKLEPPWDVFISYSAKDIDSINEIVADFKKHNITYWLDDEQIGPGDIIITQLEKGLENCRYVLACFSRNQLQSGWCRAEYQAFLNELFNNQETQKKVVPLLIDDLEQTKLPVFLRQIRETRYADKAGYKRLLEYLQGD